MRKKPKRFDPGSKWVRYDREKGLWIPSRKRVFLYWYKFLQEAEKSNDYQVDWTKYKGWGGAKVVLNTKFDDWWEERWITLFGYERTRDGAFIDGQKPRYYLSTNRPKADGIRYALMVYQNRNRGGTLEIADWIKSYEQKKSQLRSGIFWVEETFELQSRIGRYRMNGHKTLENVSIGVFP